jgi:predicted DNA-binding transcriptional regulator AlpA
MFEELIEDLIELSELADCLEKINLCTKSTLYKLSCGCYPQNGYYDDFPIPIKLGSKTYWRRSKIEAWINMRAEKTEKLFEERRASRHASTPKQRCPVNRSVDSPVGFGKGRPTRKEQSASGMNVKAWRELHSGKS